MVRSYRFSATDLIALSGVPRAFEIFDETLGGEAKAEIESFTGSKIRREIHSMNQLRGHKRYVALASLHDWDLFCFVGYTMHASDYPGIQVNLEARPGAFGREASIAAMKKVIFHEGWSGHDLDDPTAWSGIWRGASLAMLLQEEDHIAAVKSFFVESIRELKAELTAFKKEYPELPWSGG